MYCLSLFLPLLPQVLDSPFSRLVDLMLELASDQQLRIPKPLIKVGGGFILMGEARKGEGAEG